MTTAEAAAVLNVSRAWVWKLIKEQKLTATMRGRDWWIDQDEVERYKRDRKPAHRPKKEA